MKFNGRDGLLLWLLNFAGFRTIMIKKRIRLKSRPVFYLSNAVGLLLLLALTGWFISLAYENGRLQFTSVFFWMAVVLFVFLPFVLISIFSAMKEVVLTEDRLSISYVFQRHKSEVLFSQISTVVPGRGQAGKPASVLIKLSDGRAFEFHRSQFDNFDKLTTILKKHASK